MSYKLLVLVWLVAVSACVLSKDVKFKRDAGRENWTKKVISEIRSHHHENTKYGKMTPFGVISDVTRRQPDVIRSVLRDVGEASGVLDAADVERLVGQLMRDVPPLDPARCDVCVNVTGYLYSVCNVPLVESIIIGACKTIFGTIDPDTNADVLCPGTIKLQLPVICDVAGFIDRGNITEREFCESLNECSPPTAIRTHRAPSHRAPSHHTGGEGQSPTHRLRQPWKVKAGGDTITILHITDAHIQPDYSAGEATDCGLPICCSPKYNGTGVSGSYGHHQCDLPLSTVDMFLTMAATLNPDIVVYPGDSPPHSVWEETLDSQLDVGRSMVDAFTRCMPGHRVFPVIGNHDMYPTNIDYLQYRVEAQTNQVDEMQEERLLPTLFPPSGPNIDDTQRMMWGLVDMWASLAEFGAEQNATMTEGGYYCIESGVPNLKILSLNSIFNWYTFNWYAAVNNKHPENDRMKSFVNDTLFAARVNQGKVLVMTHHPIGNHDTSIRASRWWSQVALEYSDVIIMHLIGHTHYDEIRFSYDAMDEAQAMMYSAPSLTGYSSVYTNPSMRLYTINTTDWSIVDYDQYTLNLLDENLDAGSIKLTYSARDMYNLPDLTPHSWHQLISIMWDDDDLFDTYSRHYHALGRTEPCTGQCKVDMLCHLLNTNYDETVYCIQQHSPNVTSSTTEMTSSTKSSTGKTSSTTVMTSSLTSSTVIPSSTIVSLASCVKPVLGAVCLLLFTVIQSMI